MYASSQFYCLFLAYHQVDGVSPTVPRFDLSQDSSEVEPLETTTTSVLTQTHTHTHTHKHTHTQTHINHVMQGGEGEVGNYIQVFLVNRIP